MGCPFFVYQYDLRGSLRQHCPGSCDLPERVKSNDSLNAPISSKFVQPNPPTPARLTALATSRLPTLALVGVVLLYALLGLFARDPWKTEDVVVLAAMLTAADQGSWAWLFPHIGQMAVPELGPLPVWAGALFVTILSPVMNEIVAARLATLAWLLIALTALWYATYLAGRRADAQPLALPFGGEPKETQYGRLLADISVLFLIATVGILLRTHETSQAPVLLACQAIALLGAIRLTDKPFQGAGLICFAVAGGFLSNGSMGGLPLLLGSLLVIARPSVGSRQRIQVILGLGLALFLTWLWIQSVHDINPVWAREWWFWNQPQFGWRFLNEYIKTLRDLPWFLWPTWPLVLIAIWNWRRHFKSTHVWIPTSFLLAQLINITLTPKAGELAYLALAVPSAMLAAFSVPTLRRGAVNAVDWFALMCFSVSGLLVWLGWIAQQTGWPSGLARNIARQTVGYDGAFSGGAVAMALVISVTWMLVILWRLRRQPKMAWRGAVLCAAGLTSTWVLLVLLWLPTVDYVRSYRPMSTEIKSVINQAQIEAGQPLCVQATGLAIGPQASLYVFDRIEVTRNTACPLMLQQTTAERLQLGNAGFDSNARTLWTGSRGADRFDRYRLLEVKPTP
jgi:4-amino-4-deoxy-L-arabinose transferase-like glycosyltransferase